MSDPNETPAGTEAPTPPEDVDLESKTDPDGTPTENPSG